MYFTHANLVYFILEALDLEGLTIETWKKSTHPENRLPYVIDPSCGAGTFLLRAMQVITNAIRTRKDELVRDFESERYFNTRMSDTIPNSWADTFLYGMDPKFVMAITAKVNMVLHGDGSAHIFKYDALKPFTDFTGDKLRLLSDPHRTIKKDQYSFDVCESFDVVVSNPPFGITLSSETKVALPKTFSVSRSAPSESLFLERWFQLLKPKGRLGVVMPESLLNTADSVEIRLFLYRTFWIRAIVGLPRNLFIETPTLTSLLFAQKKTAKEISEWDSAWHSIQMQCERKKVNAEAFLKETRRLIKRKIDNIYIEDLLAIQQDFINKLSPIISKNTSIMKQGVGLLTVFLPSHIVTSDDACNYYLDMMKLSSFDQLIRNFVFSEMCKTFDYEYPVYMVDEVGYKLSKRKERIRPNQLCRFQSLEDENETPNLHLARGSVELIVDISKPERIIDYIRRDVKWI